MGSLHDQSNMLWGSVQAWKSLLFLWGRGFLLTSSPDVAGLDDPLPLFIIEREEKVQCVVLNMLFRDPGQMWGKLRLQRFPDPLAWKVKWAAWGTLVCEVSPTSWKRQQSSRKQQATTLGNSIQRPDILGTFTLFALCGEKLSLGAGRRHDKEIRWFLKKKKMIFQFKYHSVTEIFQNLSRLRIRLNCLELLSTTQT